MVTALLAGLLAWRWPRDDGGGGESRPSLSSDAMVLTVTGPDDTQRLVSVSTSDGTVHPIETGPLTAGFPTVSPNRDEMAFLVADSEGNQTPYLARVDGSRARRLVSAEDQPRCPYARRPAWSPDGTRLAVACQDKNQRDVALVVFDTRGHRGVVLDADRAYAGAPSWGDDSWVYFGVEDASGGATSTLWRVPDDGAASAKQWRSVPGRCLSQPDWSANGVLFRSVECGKGSGEAEVVVASPDGPVDGRKDRTLAIRDAEWPTWSSDGSAVTWLESDRLKWADAAEPRGLPGDQRTRRHPGAARLGQPLSAVVLRTPRALAPRPGTARRAAAAGRRSPSAPGTGPGW